MSNTEKKSFIRWQGRTIDQLGFVNNLLIFLATGMFVFQIQFTIREKSFSILEELTIFLSMLLIFLSLLFGCWLAWNRLKSFRLTAQIAYKREANKREGIEVLRDKVKSLDERTWLLLTIQMILFGLGALLIMIFVIINFIE